MTMFIPEPTTDDRPPQRSLRALLGPVMDLESRVLVLDGLLRTAVKLLRNGATPEVVARFVERVEVTGSAAAGRLVAISDVHAAILDEWLGDPEREAVFREFFSNRPVITPLILDELLERLRGRGQ